MDADARSATPDGTQLEAEVLRRYKEGALGVQPALCCPTSYAAKYLAVLPPEILEKDYGCGDPSVYVEAGESVLDLGSGAGKICYILAQKVGPGGRVIGADFNDAMLALARKYQGAIAAKLGYDNVRFVKARIQDLATDLEHPENGPAIANGSVDVVVSNCVLNLVRPDDKKQLFREIHRILKPTGRAVISDIVCSRDPSAATLANAELWSGCISGAFREDQFPKMFTRAGFRRVDVLARQDEPWQVHDGVEFRSMTVRASK